MKIGNSNGHVPLNRVPSEKPAPGKASAPRTQQEAAISLSTLSTQLQALETNMVDSGHFDTAKVEAIKRAIQSGQFRVNPEAVANKLIDSVRELVGKG